jgi:hypothetical protein
MIIYQFTVTYRKSFYAQMLDSFFLKLGLGLGLPTVKAFMPRCLIAAFSGVSKSRRPMYTRSLGFMQGLNHDMDGYEEAFSTRSRRNPRGIPEGYGKMEMRGE